MPHYAKRDVISREDKQFKLKYIINKTLQRKSKKKTCLTVLNFPSGPCGRLRLDVVYAKTTRPLIS